MLKKIAMLGLAFIFTVGFAMEVHSMKESKEGNKKSYSSCHLWNKYS